MDNQNAQNALTEKEMMTDVLSTQKFITDAYNTFSNECSSPNVRNTFMNILNDEHKIQFEVFDEMSKRGWYPTQNADQTKVNQVKQQYAPNAQ